MQYQQGDYTVVSASPLEAGRTGIATADVPEPLRDRFYGRRFTRQELEEKGVELRGDLAIVKHEGRAWVLNLTPKL
jgi:hypothetical protein